MTSAVFEALTRPMLIFKCQVPQVNVQSVLFALYSLKLYINPNYNWLLLDSKPNPCSFFVMFSFYNLKSQQSFNYWTKDSKSGPQLSTKCSVTKPDCGYYRGGNEKITFSWFKSLLSVQIFIIINYFVNWPPSKWMHHTMYIRSNCRLWLFLWLLKSFTRF